MSNSNLYIFLLCLMVFLISAIFLGLVLVYVYKLEARSIRAGILDEEIREYKVAERAEGKGKTILSNVFGFTMLALVCACFTFGLVTYLTNYDQVGDVPSFKVVLSESMQEKYEKNTYLFDNDLNNQISKYDLVVINKLPAEEEIKLYDIVVYEAYTGDLVIHRIVDIEEPNEEHPDYRQYTFQGDNVESADVRKIRYSQMRGIYSGTRIPYVGKIVAFFQSYAGYLCVGIVVFYVIVSPFIEKKQEKLIDARAELIFQGATPEAGDKPDEDSEETPAAVPEETSIATEGTNGEGETPPESDKSDADPEEPSIAEAPAPENPEDKQ